jgi:hypothetical protein
MEHQTPGENLKSTKVFNSCHIYGLLFYGMDYQKLDENLKLTKVFNPCHIYGLMFYARRCEGMPSCLRSFNYNVSMQYVSCG